MVAMAENKKIPDSRDQCLFISLIHPFKTYLVIDMGMTGVYELGKRNICGKMAIMRLMQKPCLVRIHSLRHSKGAVRREFRHSALFSSFSQCYFSEIFSYPLKKLSTFDPN